LDRPFVVRLSAQPVISSFLRRLPHVIAFALLFCPAAFADVTLIPTGATWAYRDDGTDQGSAWRGLSFDDSSWAIGAAQLGYGDGDEATVISYGPNASQKYITTYFRRAFTIPDPALFGGLTLRTLRDDGAVVYVNGTEAWRSNMPSGAIAYTTLASTSIVSSGETTFTTAQIDPSLLVSGTNVLAVEIHQVSLVSSDVSFDLELIGTPVIVTRGPYLQSGTSSSVRIRWRTSTATNSRVRYGTTAANLDLTADDGAITTEHEIALTGLSAATTYSYSIGTTADVLAGDGSYFFVTSPLSNAASNATGTTRIWVLGDSGTANADAAAVRDAYYAFTGAVHTNLWLMLGDNAYVGGTDAEYQGAVFDMYPTMLRKSVLWPTIGNHDTAQATTVPPTLPYFQIFSLPAAAEAGGLASGTEKYYSFDYANIHFVCLDSMTSARSPVGPMLTWLQNDLAATTKQWIIAFWHHPPYSKGSHDSDVEIELREMRQNALPILEDYGVDLVLSGHSHSYERSYLIDSHYGPSTQFISAMKKDGGSGRPGDTGPYRKETAPHNGAVYAVAGTSGQIAPGELNHPAMFISMSNLGSLVLDVTGNRADVKFIRETGAVGDSFTIVKGTPAAPTEVNARATGATEVTIGWTIVANATGYQIERRGSGTPFVAVGGSANNVFVDGNASSGMSYLYRVIATNSAGPSAPSAADLATTIPLTDDPLVPAVTPIRATHLGELRLAVNAVRALAGLPAASFSGAASPGTEITAMQINELRSALGEALSVLGVSAGGYTDSVTAGVLVKALHFQELRSRVE
jgi:Calcineurin-like phosphoesterase/Purple acid Phosphatase, N-terminal domain